MHIYPEIIWTKNGVPVQLSETLQLAMSEKLFVFPHVELKDEGIYNCEVSDGNDGSQWNEFNLQIQSVPYFTVEPKSKTDSENETIGIHCEGNGVPNPEFQWTYNGKL